MRWSPGGSQDLEDRRGQGGGGRFGMSGGRLGLGGLVVLLILSLVFKQTFFSRVGIGGGDQAAPAGPVQSTAQEEQQKQFIAAVLDSVQTSWDQLLPQQAGTPYQHAHLVLFRDGIESACGLAESATGPFYCPGDHKVYIDLGFFQELAERFGAQGDFAQAYVLAHEIGHHVQLLLGTEAKMRELQGAHPAQAKELSVRFELQADCYAGVWGSIAAQHGTLDPGDTDEGLNAAAAVGDDRIQRMTTGHVSPEAFTHGSAEQRSQWFRQGLRTGKLTACDTFGAP
jgi:predicted metalloprotease